MKVINVTPGLLPIPPNGWGAVEKIIWDYHLQLKAKGIDSEIKYLNDIKYDDSMVVHVHVANLANECHNRGIPYIFTIHDHHAYLYGKDSSVFKENLKAIENSVLSTSPCKFLVPYFGSKKLRYFSHAVNTETFVNKNSSRDSSLLCVANNGYAGNPKVDRKGFKIAIEAAKALGMPITIAGPKNNENFFSTLPDELNNYSGLTKIYGPDEKSLIDIYNAHSIFLHFSELEAGHPNLTLLEAMSCGLPIVGTFEENSYKGMKVTERNTESGINGIKEVIENYQFYKTQALENAKANCYSNRVLELIDLYSEYREAIFANRLIESYKNTKKSIKINRFIVSFNDGVKAEVLGSDKKQYVVDFIDKDLGAIVYRSNINNNMWCAPSKKFFTNWQVNIYEKVADKDLILVYSEGLDLKGKRVKINLETSSLGDLLAYVPVVDAFQKKHECIVDCTVLNKDLLLSMQPNYPNIKFVNGTYSNDGYYARYEIGYFMEDWQDRIGENPRNMKLNHIPSKVLGIDPAEDKPKLSFANASKPNKKYVCIATQSTSQCKYWNNKNGWKDLIKFLNSKGYEVWCIDKHHTFGNQIMNSVPEGAIDKTGDLPLELRMAQIFNAEFFIGLGSGLSWLAWALNKPVVLISGFSKPLAEFSTPYRIINENVCNGCWNDSSQTFDRSNWLWCPRNKDFECTKTITTEMVIEKINSLL
jgi:autotransporter strand-loop-strand O-heptosyltransferase